MIDSNLRKLVLICGLLSVLVLAACGQDSALSVQKLVSDASQRPFVTITGHTNSAPDGFATTWWLVWTFPSMRRGSARNGN